VPAVGTEGHALDGIRVAPKGKDGLAGRRIPDLHGPVQARCGDALAVRAERRFPDSVFVSTEGEDLLAGLSVPAFCRGVRTGREQALALRAKGYAPDIGLEVACEAEQFFA
jgi:hypothetical protein